MTLQEAQENQFKANLEMVNKAESGVCEAFKAHRETEGGQFPTTGAIMHGHGEVLKWDILSSSGGAVSYLVTLWAGVPNAPTTCTATFVVWV